jgi:hypothetical protein
MRKTLCRGCARTVAQKGGVGAHLIVPMDFWQKRLGYLRDVVVWDGD